jgi:hyperosmotically inducible protein
LSDSPQVSQLYSLPSRTPNCYSINGGKKRVKLKLITSVLAIGVLFGGSSPKLKAAQQAQQPAQAQPAAQTDPSKAAPSQDQPKSASSDRDIMQKIHKALMDDTSLANDVKSVKITSQNGKVTLKGSVPTEEDKKNVEQKATEVAGPGNVTNELTVKAAKKTSENMPKEPGK